MTDERLQQLVAQSVVIVRTAHPHPAPVAEGPMMATVLQHLILREEVEQR